MSRHVAVGGLIVFGTTISLFAKIGERRRLGVCFSCSSFLSVHENVTARATAKRAAPDPLSTHN